MTRIEYRLTIATQCPLDRSDDQYECVIRSFVMIPVERILEEIQKLKNQGAYQETLTESLARTFSCHVTTHGYHSGVETTVEAQ